MSDTTTATTAATTADAARYEDITTNLVSLGTGKGGESSTARAGGMPAGLIVAGLFFSDRTLFRRVERGLQTLPADPNKGAAEIVILPAGPDLARISAGIAWLDGETGKWVVALGESLAPRTDIDLWRDELTDAGAAISIDGPRGLSRFFGEKFSGIRATVTDAPSLDALLRPDAMLPDARRALREGIRRRRVARAGDAPLRTVVPQSTSLNEPGVGLAPDDPALALPQFRFVFTEQEEFKRIRAALEQPAPDTYDLYGEALVIPTAEYQAVESEGEDAPLPDADHVIVVGIMAWRRASTGWTMLAGAVRTQSALVNRWLDDGTGDQRTRVLLATVNKRGSSEQPVAIDLLCRVTDLRPEMRDENERMFAPDQEAVATLVRAAAFQIAGDTATLADAPTDAIAMARDAFSGSNEQ